MKRVFVLLLALLLAPALVSAQVEIGIDAGLSIESYDEPEGFTGDIDSDTGFQIPTSSVRVAFPAGENVLMESLVGFSYFSSGDDSFTVITLLPGVNFLLNEQFYVRGEVGLLRLADEDDSVTQFGFGGAAGLRKPLGDAALFRLEGGVDKWLEKEEDGQLGSWSIRALAGISVIIN